MVEFEFIRFSAGGVGCAACNNNLPFQSDYKSLFCSKSKDKIHSRCLCNYYWKLDDMPVFGEEEVDHWPRDELNILRML